MSNFHPKTLIEAGGRLWKPVKRPKRGEDRTHFYAFMLLPGLSNSFYAAVLGCSRSSVALYRAAAAHAARSNPQIAEAVESQIGAMRAEHGMQMAQMRGKAQLPFWSRLAICDYRKRGFSRRSIATAFRCSLGTVTNALRGSGTSYSPLSGVRVLTSSQRQPVGQWQRASWGNDVAPIFTIPNPIDGRG